MIRPYNGIPILTQWKHSPKGTRHDALDLAPTWQMKLLRLLGVYTVREAKIIKQVTKTSKRDGYVVYMTRDGCEHYRVHVLPREKLKIGKWYPSGTRVGTIDLKPVYATGPHDHHFIVKDGKPVDVVKWYARRGIGKWFSDPLKLQR